MKMPLKWMMPALPWLLLTMTCCTLSGCATKSGAQPGMVDKVAEAAAARMQAAQRSLSAGQVLEVPVPDGQARVLVTPPTMMLQRHKDGPLEELDVLTPGDEVLVEAEGEERAKKMKELAQGVHWSPRGTRVCILRQYKRGSDVAVFPLASQPAAEVELDLEILQKATTERYGGEFRHGRFYYITFSRWLNEDDLEIEFSGNLIPKEGDDGMNWKWYHGSARLHLGAASGTVQGPLQWQPLMDG